MSHESHTHDGRSFDERAATWDDPTKVERARRVADAIATATGSTSATTLLEYGAGTGLVTEAMGDRVGPAVLADTSAGMRAEIEAKVHDGRLSNGTRVLDLDLDAPGTRLPDERFDLVVTVLTLHHVGNLDRVLRCFAELTSPGGHVCVVDLDAEDGSFHGEGFGGHNGFDRDEVAGLLRRAGLVEVSVSDCGVVARDDGDYPMFLAIGLSPTPDDLAAEP